VGDDLLDLCRSHQSSMSHNIVMHKSINLNLPIEQFYEEIIFDTQVEIPAETPAEA
jgi:hypothetical protein